MEFNRIAPLESRSSIRDTPLTLFLQEIANYVCTIGGYDFCSVLLHDEPLHCLRILGVANLSMEYVQRINEEDALQLEQPQMGYAPSTIAYLQKRPVAIHDVFADEDFKPWLADAQREGYRALLCVPLLIDDNAVGVLDVYQRSVHTFTEDEISFFTTVAGLAAMAVEARQTSERLQASLAALRDARELHRRMLNASGLDQVGQTLSDFLNCCVVITDPNGTCLWSNAKFDKVADLGQALGPDWLQYMRQATTGDVLLFSPEWQSHASAAEASWKPTQAAIAMYGSGTPQGYILVDLEESIAEEALRLDLEEASLVAAHILLEERRRLDVLHQSQEELASDILHGRLRNRESILARAANLGFDVRSPHAVVVMPQQKVLDKALQRLNLQPHPSPLISHEGHESLVLLLPVLERHEPQQQDPSPEGKDPALEIWSKLHAQIEQEKGIVVASGEILPIEQAAQSYQQAESAMKVLRVFQVQDGYLWYPKAGVLGILAASTDAHKLVEYSRTLLAPLFSHEEHSGADLLTTLRTYLRSDLRVSTTASKLYIHSNTVYYRLRKIETLTGLSLDRQSDRLQLEVAVLIHDLHAAGKKGISYHLH